jgi:hypothetical protein
MLKSFRIARYRFDLEAVDSLHLPPYKGSTFRGGFGHAFKKMVCAQANWRACTPCMLGNNCPYGYIFDSTAPENSAIFHDLRDVPIPFLIEPDPDRKTVYRPGDRLSFNVILIGRAIGYLPYFVLAYQELGRMGVGKPRGRYVLQRIVGFHPWKRADTLVFDGIDVRVGTELDISFADAVERAALLSNQKLTLRFVTPTRIKHQGQYVRRPDFHVLIRTLLRRISSLAYFHGGEIWTPDIHHLIAKAESIETTHLAVDWVDWDRFSGRQQQRIDLSGFVGEATYQGDLDLFRPLLALGEIVHIGKATVFGHGQYRIDQS